MNLRAEGYPPILQGKHLQEILGGISRWTLRDWIIGGKLSGLELLSRKEKGRIRATRESMQKVVDNWKTWTA